MELLSSAFPKEFRSQVYLLLSELQEMLEHLNSLKGGVRSVQAAEGVTQRYGMLEHMKELVRNVRNSIEEKLSQTQETAKERLDEVQGALVQKMKDTLRENPGVGEA